MTPVVDGCCTTRLEVVLGRYDTIMDVVNCEGRARRDLDLLHHDVEDVCVCPNCLLFHASINKLYTSSERAARCHMCGSRLYVQPLEAPFPSPDCLLGKVILTLIRVGISGSGGAGLKLSADNSINLVGPIELLDPH